MSNYKGFILDVDEVDFIFMHKSSEDFNDIIKTGEYESNEVYDIFKTMAIDALAFKNEHEEDNYEIGNVNYMTNIISAQFVKRQKLEILPKFKRKLKMLVRSKKR